MKRLHFALSIIVLFGFTVSGCGQQQEAGSQTEAEGTDWSQNKTAAEPGRQLAEPAITAQAKPLDGDAARGSSRNLVENAARNKKLTTFVSLLRSAEMVSNLSGTGPYTVFVPAETAFRALPGSTLKDLMKPENRTRLENVLNNHIIAGKLTIDDLQDGAMLKTAAGQQLKVSKRNGQVMINGALIEDADGMSKNGVLHTINRLLLPAEE